MSLLMDALRRAEREKKAAAEKLKEKEDSLKGNWPDAEGLSLIPEEDDDKQGADPQDKEQSDDSGDVSHSHDPDATLAEARENLELDSYQDVSDTRDRETGESSESIDYQSSHDQAYDHLDLSLESDDHPHEADNTVTPQGDNESTGHGESSEKLTIDMSGEAGEQTLSSDKEDTNNTLILEDYPLKSGKDEVSEDEATLEQTRTYSESTGNELHSSSRDKQQSGYQSPVAAQNVFAAKKNKSQTVLTIAILILLIAIGLTAAGFFYYYSVTPVTRQIVSPRVAEDIAEPRSDLEGVSVDNPDLVSSDIEPLPPPVTVNSSDEASTIDTANDDSEQTLVAGIDDKTGTDKQQDSRSAENQSASGSEIGGSTGDTQGNGGSAVVESSLNKTESTGRDSARDEEAAVNKTDDKIQEELELRPALVKISRSIGQSKVDETVSRAYQAYMRNELEQARRLYEQVLASNPDNRNALLGLGAIAVRLKELDRAYRYYGDILEQNPADRIAQTALISIQKQADPGKSEARIMRLIEAEPEAAYLYQALGHVYARTQRWPQAQQAYFDAFSRDSTNADYAFNLAVSLEQLNQTTAALKYYREALALSKNQPISFERTTAQRRINQINKTDSK